MALGTWWRGDALPELPALPPFSAEKSIDREVVARLTQLEAREIEQRFGEGHHIYLAWMGKEPVAYGWVATREGRIRDLQLSFPLSSRDRYLWDFKTLPEWRGRGIYPLLLQHIIRQELAQADRFWIGFVPGNEASKRGISKAGFQIVGDFSFGDGHKLAFKPYTVDERGLAGARFYQIPLALP